MAAQPSQRGGLHVQGINHEATNELDRRFSWEINQYGLRDSRYDFSGCAFAPGARDRLGLLRALAERKR
jgi:ABC-type proline/glycine betaine transport system ATPase subunit